MAPVLVVVGDEAVLCPPLVVGVGGGVDTVPGRHCE